MARCHLESRLVLLLASAAGGLAFSPRQCTLATGSRAAACRTSAASKVRGARGSFGTLRAAPMCLQLLELRHARAKTRASPRLGLATPAQSSAPAQDDPPSPPLALLVLIVALQVGRERVNVRCGDLLDKPVRACTA